MKKFYTNVTPIGNKFLHSFVDNSGNRHHKIEDIEIDLFVPSNTEEKYFSLHGDYLKKKSFSSVAKAKEFVNEYSGVSNIEIHGNRNYWAQFIRKTYPDDIDWDVSQIKIGWLDIEVMVGDNGFPEPTVAPNMVTAITIAASNDKYYIFGLKDYIVRADDEIFVKCKNEKELLFKFLLLLKQEKFDIITHWNGDGFDVPYLINRVKRVLGEEFLPAFAPKLEGKYRKCAISEPSQFKKKYEIAGCASLDYMEMYKTFTYKQREKYSLDFICHVELDENKLDYSEYGNLDDLYENNPQLYYEYNVRDVRLIKKLDEKLNLMMLVLTLSYKSKIPFDKVFSQVAMWDTFIYNGLMDSNIAVPPKEKFEKAEKYAGAFVKNPEIKLLNWLLSFDLNSLYPSIMRQLLISPENIVNSSDLHPDFFPYWNENLRGGVIDIGFDIEDFIDKKHHVVFDLLKKHGLAMSPNGSLYKNNPDAIIPRLLDGVYSERVVYKDKMLKAERNIEKIKQLLNDDPNNKKLLDAYNEQEYLAKKYKVLQMGTKVFLNSCYGALGNEHFRFYDIRMAEGITLFGQLAIQWVAKYVDEFLSKKFGDDNYVKYIDTDAIYFTLERYVETLGVTDINEIVEKLDEYANDIIQPVIDKSYSDLKDYLNSHNQFMIMKREVIASKAFWRAKKNYAMLIYNSEGVPYENGKLKIMGMEPVRSATPELCRNALKKSIDIIFRKDEESLQEFVAEFRRKFYSANINDISFPRGVNNITKWLASNGVIKKATPIHVTGAINYNRELEKRPDLLSRYKEIKNGDKIKFIYLVEPNPTFLHVISYPDILPPEFSLHQYIDKDMQFDKTFFNPIQSYCDVIGWSPIKQNRLF